MSRLACLLETPSDTLVPVSVKYRATYSIPGASALRAVIEDCVGGFGAKQDTARVNQYSASKKLQRIQPGGVLFGISMTTVVLDRIDTPIIWFVGFGVWHLVHSMEYIVYGI